MSRRNKKRTKKYSGEDAKQFNASVQAEPIVHHYTAVERSRLGQWWYDHKRVVKPVSIAIAALLLIVWLVIELVRVLS